MLSDNFIDVHQFDGKIDIPVLTTFTKDQKIDQIKTLLPKLTKTSALKIIQTITNTIIQDSNENFDDINNVDASDILANILAKSYDSLLDIIEEQLEDIWELGQCPQGRTIRFIQMYRSME